MRQRRHSEMQWEITELRPGTRFTTSHYHPKGSQVHKKSECHRKMKHSRVWSTLGELWSRFWVLKGRQVVKKILRDCLTCKREQGKSFGLPPGAAIPGF